MYIQCYCPLGPIEMGLAAILLLDEVLQGSCRTYNAMIGRCDMRIFTRKYIIIVDTILIINKCFKLQYQSEQ